MKTIVSLLALIGTLLTACSSEPAGIDILRRDKLKTTAHYFPAGEHVTQLYAERLLYLAKQTRHYQDQITNGKPVLKASSEALYREFNAEYELMKATNGWAVILLSRVLLEENDPKLFVCTLRPEKQPVDIVLIMESPGSVEDSEFRAHARKTMEYYEKFTEQQWQSLPIAESALFDRQGNLTSAALKKRLSPAVFVGPK